MLYSSVAALMLSGGIHLGFGAGVHDHVHVGVLLLGHLLHKVGGLRYVFGERAMGPSGTLRKSSPDAGRRDQHIASADFW